MFYLIILTLLSFNNFWLILYYLFVLMFLIIIKFDLSLYFSNLSFGFGFDNLSYFMIILSIWIVGLMQLSSMKVYKENNYPGYFVFNLLLLLMSLLILFCTTNFFMFYIFFEISLIPLLILMLGWGYNPERYMASYYLMFYTLFFSLPMMVGLFLFMGSSKSMFMFEFQFIYSGVSYFFIMLVFFVKMPMFMVHLWLPKAHVEAPVAGSMILAGIMLKLGGYGMIRFLPYFMKINLLFNVYFLSISMLGGTMISLICLWQSDIKSLIAYSSVSHMSLVMSGLLSLNYLGLMGSLVLMISHGLCSSGLFCLANYYYERFSSRSMYIIKGLINIFPSISFWMFMFSSFNMAAPPSLNLLGEVVLFNSISSYSLIMMVFLMVLSFFSAVYSIYLYAYTQHGKVSSIIYCSFYGVNREFLLMVLHFMPLLFLILVSDSFNF
uniref:NADH-ubiquinone oxidoreductase chain 4 n=1 Tax=Callispa bowringii TaxID=2558238 RepID=A0A482JJC0_9CUCU|nr:NADH dehydrogenase subunit 4 [Callispa bowringii]QBP33865.1 NADH dehydrogenase subunit 4 [Callispa bowringii]